MDHLINPKDVVKAYQLIRENGQKEPEGFRYKGLLAENDLDGYTVFVTDGKVNMAVYYHYKYNLEYTDKKELERFKGNIEAILREAQ